MLRMAARTCWRASLGLRACVGAGFILSRSMRGRSKIIASFIGFGLINNLLYVVILSSAIDLVGPSTPKGLVLLADVLPSFLFKLSAPFYFHVVKYPFRIGIIVGTSFLGMQIIANSSGLGAKLFGIVLASLSSGVGEVTFLQLTHYFEEYAVHAWSSGTGAAGLVGSSVFLVLTTWIRVSTRTTLFLFSLVPFSVAAIYFYGLPAPSMLSHSTRNSQNSRELSSGSSLDEDEDNRSSIRPKTRVQLLQSLLFPFVLPLMTVYIAEYIINQGISPTLLYDLLDMPMFYTYRDAYVMYGTLYQIGVFISRSSGTIIRIQNLWLLAILQTINVALALLQSLFMFNPSIYLTFIFMVYEGLLGGAAYVNTFSSVSNSVSLKDREFAMGAVTMSDSSGIVVAALMSMMLEPSLCQYQINHGRPWCELT